MRASVLAARRHSGAKPLLAALPSDAHGGVQIHSPFAAQKKRTEPAWPWIAHFTAIFCFRLLSAFFAPVMDCDETFNYVEPLHFIMYGRGLQTWEYSSEYSLRSYLFLWPFAIVGHLARWAGVEHDFGKIGVLFTIKAWNALCCSVCQAIFIAAVARRFGRRTSNIFFTMLLFAAGMTHAGHAILPQSFTMNVLTLAFAFFVDATDPLATPKQAQRAMIKMIAAVAVAGLLGWPFVVVLALPMAWHVLASHAPWAIRAGALPAPYTMFQRLTAAASGSSSGDEQEPSPVASGAAADGSSSASASGSSSGGAGLRRRGASKPPAVPAALVGAMLPGAEGSVQQAAAPAPSQQRFGGFKWLCAYYCAPLALCASSSSPLAQHRFFSFLPLAPTVYPRLRSIALLAFAAAVCGAGVLVPSVLVDWVYYRRFPVVAVWNIAMYNSNFAGDSSDDGAGQQLYGTEPLSYYFANLFLNFNIVFLFAMAHALVAGFAMFLVYVVAPLGLWPSFLQALLAPAAAEAPATPSGSPAGSAATPAGSMSDAAGGASVTRKRSMSGANAAPPVIPHAVAAGAAEDAAPATVGSAIAPICAQLSVQFVLLTPLYMWCLVMFPQPHKEERFLYVIYPLVCLAGTWGTELFLALAQAATDAIAARFRKAVALSASSSAASASGKDSPSHSAAQPSVVSHGSAGSSGVRTRPWRRTTWVLAIAIYLSYCTLSVSRAFALLYNYSAPTVTFFSLYTQLAASSTPGLLAFALAMTEGATPSRQAAAGGPIMAPNSSASINGSKAASIIAAPSMAAELVHNPNFYNLTGSPPLGYPLETFPRLDRATGTVNIAGLSQASAQHLVAQSTLVRVCMGKEWYRFPSSFFLPEATWRDATPEEKPSDTVVLGKGVGAVVGSKVMLRPRVDIDFIDCDFGGLLPQHFSFNTTNDAADANGADAGSFASLVSSQAFSVTAATATPARNMNNLNRRDETRFVPIDVCDFVVDTDLGVERTHPKDVWRNAKRAGEWEPMASVPMLDADLSSGFSRAFYVHGLWQRQNKFVDLTLWRRVRTPPAASKAPQAPQPTQDAPAK